LRLRTKVLAAQLPLVGALAITSIVGVVVTRAQGKGAQAILQDNYRSVLAAQNIKESAERIDSGILFEIAGKTDRGAAQIDANLPKLDHELAVQEDNITERGERDATRQLRTAWTAYAAEVRADRADPRPHYFDALLPKFLAVKDSADRILAMNQDAMIQKSDRAEHLGDEANRALIAVSALGLLLAGFASSVMTARVLRPLSVMGQTARRLGEGDLAVRAAVGGNDELSAVARELNLMADHLQRYRTSSLGELVEAQLAAQATIDSLPDPVLVIGLDGELRHANQAAETILRVSAESGAGALAALAPDVRATVEKLRLHVAGGHGGYIPKGLEEAIVVGDRALLPRAAPLYAQEGDVVAATIVLQDVSRLRRFEELRNDLVATVAHELRTPLTSLRMAVHLLAEETVAPLAPKQADLVFAAREECERLQGIVDELLDLSRIQGDRMELRLAALDPEQVVRTAVEAHGGTAEVLPGLPPVAVDPERIQLVLGNLIGNAQKYAGGEITVRAAERGDRVRFEVEDRGPGIPADYASSIFDKYVRVPGAAAGGAGIGLYIAREIVRAHGGEIGVESEPGGGARFWFTVKRA
jgi:signal transduction histidine kinase/HAMP domain-containing protein